MNDFAWGMGMAAGFWILLGLAYQLGRWVG